MTTATATAPAPTTAEPATAAAAPAAPVDPAPKPGGDSLLRAPAAPAALASTTPATAPEAFDFAEKVRVFAADGKLDEVATGKKAEKARAALEKRLGVGDVRPDKADAYTFTPPDDLKGLLDDTRSAAWKEKAHELGLTQAQYEASLAFHLADMPELIKGGAAVSKGQAEAELKKAWKTNAEFEANLGAAQTATSALPADVQEALHLVGTQPAVVRALAYFGSKMKPDTPPIDTGGVPAGFDPNDPAVMAIAKDTRHPQHEKVVAQRRAAFDAQAKKQPQ